MINITDKRENSTIDVDELNVGDVFVRQGSYYLRITGITTEYDDYYNAINLKNMGYAEIPSGEAVLKVNAELVIRW